MKHHKQALAQGGLGKVHQLFGAELPKVIEELNRELAA
jgi:type I restriction enzyme R subunit